MPPGILSTPNSGRTKAVEGSSRDLPGLKILFLITEDWAFVSHRLPLARAARDAGAEMFVMTHLSDLRPKLEREGFTVIPWNMLRRSLNPFREVGAFLQVIRVYRRVRPDLLYHVALKPVVYGGLAARLCGRTASVNEIAGVGHVFTSCNRRMRLLRRGLLMLLRLSLGGENTKTVLQNNENRALLTKEGVVPLSMDDCYPRHWRERGTVCSSPGAHWAAYRLASFAYAMGEGHRRVCGSSSTAAYARHKRTICTCRKA